MMSNLTEKVARALMDRIGSPFSYEEMPPETKSLWDGHAKAAIAVVLDDLMEPSDKMIEVGVVPRDDEGLGQAFKAMIVAKREELTR